MGNKTSTINNKNPPSKFMGMMDSIASKYILTQNFTDLKNLENKEYCNKLVILTSDIFNERLQRREIEYMNQRIKSGIEVNELSKDTLTYLEKEDLTKLDTQNSIKKQRMCIGISKFYVKIAHLYAALIMTLNPVYEYKDENGIKQSVPFMKKKMIPKELRSSTTIKKMNLCSKRINSILINQIKTQDASGNKQATDELELSNNICGLNKSDTDNSSKTLLQEPGIFELKQLYYDVFDYKTNSYTKMSDASKKEYLNDVGEFYKAFTGNKSVPKEIQNFSDIILKDYHNQDSCKNKDSMLLAKLKGNKDDKLFQSLGGKLQISISKTNQFRDNFIKILDDVFITQIDNVTNNKEITIHPLLTMKKLGELVKTARSQIVQMYISCEKDFNDIIDVYEAIIESQLKKNIDMKIKNIESLKQNNLAQS
jgi:hypothetical protein